MLLNKCFLITYDLKNKLIFDYNKLYDEIKRSQKWWHFLESTWLIAAETANQVCNRLHDKIHKDDYLMVIEVRGDRQGWMPNDAWEWINENVSKI